MNKEKEERNNICGKIADNIGDLIYSYKQKGITQKEQAVKIGIKPSSLSKYVSGSAIPDGMSLYKMAKYYKCSTDYLLGRTSNPSPNINIAEITNKYGLSLEAINSLFYINNYVNDYLKIKIFNILLTNNIGERLIDNMRSYIFSKCIDFQIFDKGESLRKPNINVNTTTGGYELFAPETDNILLLDMINKIKDLKNEYSNNNNIKDNMKYFEIRKPPEGYTDFLCQIDYKANDV